MPYYKVYVDYAISETACNRIVENGIPPEIYSTPVRVFSVLRSPEQTVFEIFADSDVIAKAWQAAIKDAISLIIPFEFTPPTPYPAPTPLDVWARVGTWTKTIASATTTIGSLPDTPKGVILWGSGLSGAVAGTYNEAGAVCVGFSNGTSDRFFGTVTQDNMEPVNANRATISKAFALLDPTGTNTTHITNTNENCTVSFGATSFDLNWNATTLATQGGYFVFGGDDIAEVAIKDFVAGHSGSTVPQTVEYTGLGNTFDFALFLVPFLVSGGGAAWPASTGTASGLQSISVKAGSTPSKSWSSTISVRDGVTSPGSEQWRLQRTNKLILTMSTSSQAQQQYAEWHSWTSDGFKMTWMDLASSDQFLWTGMFVRGGKWECGSLLQPTTNTTSTTLLADAVSQLQGVVGVSVANTVHTGTGNGIEPAKMSIGAEDSTGNRACLAFSGVGGTPSQATVLLNNKFMRHITAASTASSSTTNAESTISDIGTDGQFTLNWTTTDSTIRETVWFSLSA